MTQFFTDPELENTENSRERRWTAISIAETLLRSGVIVDLDAEEETGRSYVSKYMHSTTNYNTTVSALLLSAYFIMKYHEHCSFCCRIG